MQQLRKLLLPFSWIYCSVTFVRNKLFDWGIWKSYTPAQKSISVGNLSVGGTGKTPHILLLQSILKEDYPTALISRGYGRKTTGFILADATSTAAQIGDEPALFQLKNPSTPVLVSEKRVVACQFAEHNFPTNTIQLLDDAYQHRWVKPGLSILLTEFDRPFFNDWVLPAGNLRESRVGVKRADIVLVTKCPSEISASQKAYFEQKINCSNDQLYFSRFEYAELEDLKGISHSEQIDSVLLVTGIANPKPLQEFLQKKYTVHTIQFADHHQFSPTDIDRIHEIFGNFARENKVIVTTSKDAVRLSSFQKQGLLQNYPWMVQKIEVKIERENQFREKIKSYVREI